MSHFASLISKFDPKSHLILVNQNQATANNHSQQQHTTTTTTTTTLHLYRSNQQTASSSCTTSGINTNTNSSSLSNCNAANSTTTTTTTNPNSNLGTPRLAATAAAEPGLANSSVSKFYNNFNHTLTDSSTTGGTGTSTKSTNLFSLLPNNNPQLSQFHLNDKEAALGADSSDSVKLNNNKNRYNKRLKF